MWPSRIGEVRIGAIEDRCLISGRLSHEHTPRESCLSTDYSPPSGVEINLSSVSRAVGSAGIGQLDRSAMRALRIAMAQMNPTVGDLNGNLHRITTWIRDAKKVKADLVVFPELAITGSPPEDLLFKAQFVAENVRVLNEIAQACRGVVAVVGYVDKETNAIHIPSGRRCAQPVGLRSIMRPQ